MTAVAGPRLRLPTDQDASGRSFDGEELEALRRALDSGALSSTRGSLVAELERHFADLLGVREAIACASGTAAIHAAIAAIDPEPGDEIVTTPITDMGAIAPILYQTAVPAFADVDPRTLNVTADTVRAALGPRTRAIVLTHLFGRPCDLDPILELAREHGLPVIEDCAQAYLASYRGRPVGSFGDIACFSLQQGKHMTCGEGGLVVTDDADTARRLRLFVNKGWPYGEADPDHLMLALNGRMSELQGAVALAQLGKLEHGVARRRHSAAQLSERLRGIDALEAPLDGDGVHASYWRYHLRVSPDLPGGADGLAAALRLSGVASAPRYIRKPAFKCDFLVRQKTFGASRFPFTAARPEALDYRAERFPGTFAGLRSALVLPWNERLEGEHVDYLAECLAAATGAARGDG